MAIKDIFKLKAQENRLYLVLTAWLLIGLAVFQIASEFGVPLIGIIIYLPFMAFTLFLYIVSFFKDDINQYGRKKIVLMLLLSLLLMPILLIILLGLFVISILSYIVLTSIFTLYGCYAGGRKLDENLYFKKGAWFWRGLEFWGGLAFALIMLFLSLFGTIYGIILTRGASPVLLINVAYLIIIIVLIALSAIAVIIAVSGRFNAWLGAYSAYVSIYTLYLVLKVFMGVGGGGTGGATSSIWTQIGLIFFDVAILLYSIGGLIGTQAKILNRKLKLKPETAFFWLIFSRAAWEFAVNFPYEMVGEVEAGWVQNLIVVGSLLNLITSIAVLVLFIFLVIIFGLYGIVTYGKEKAERKRFKEEIGIAKDTGERVDITMAEKDIKVVSHVPKIEEEEEKKSEELSQEEESEEESSEEIEPKTE